MILLHGENKVGSREELGRLRKEAKGKGLEVVAFEGKSLELTNLTQAMESNSLFGGDRLVVVEELFGARVSKRVERVLEYLTGLKGAKMVLWEGKKVDGRRLRRFKDWQVKEFKVGASIFPLVESIGPGNTAGMLRSLEKALRDSPAELVFFMICRQVRMMIEVLEGGYKGPGWLASKLKVQASKFGLEGLVEFHGRLYEVERNQKTGRTPLELRVNLELLLGGL